MNKTFDAKSAEKEYWNLIRNRLPEPFKWDKEAYDYHHEEMGRESTNTGYRSAIFYIQLTNKIDPKILEGFLKTTERCLVDSFSTKPKFNMLFLNDADGKLLHQGRICFGRTNALRTATDFLSKYSETNNVYSKELHYLFPPIGFYTSEHYPSNEDLCVLVTDEDGVEIDEKIRQRALRLPNRFIQIKVLPGNMFEVFKLRKEELGVP